MSNIHHTPHVNPDALAPADWIDPVLAAADEETLRDWRKAQQLARDLWRMAMTATASDYSGACVSPRLRGLRRSGNMGGGVLVPLRDMFGELWNLQPLHNFNPDSPSRYISGTPRLLVNARETGLHYWHGKRIEGDGAGRVIGILEHATDANTWHSETRVPCVVAFWPENFAPLASALRAVFPAATVVFWARRERQEPPMQDAASRTGAHIVCGNHGLDLVRPLGKRAPSTSPAGGAP